MDVRLARVALVSAYLIGGVNKLFDFTAAVAEQEHFGFIRHGYGHAGDRARGRRSLLVVTGRLVWLGAGGLGVLTFVAMLVANNFWSTPDRFASWPSYLLRAPRPGRGFVLVSIRAEQTSPEPLSHERMSK